MAESEGTDQWRPRLVGVNFFCLQNTLLLTNDCLFFFCLFYVYSCDLSVLIVDDDRAVRDSIRRAMMSYGAQKQFIIDVQEAKNGREAVYLHLGGASFDIILMDSQMPVMKGHEVYVF